MLAAMTAAPLRGFLVLNHSRDNGFLTKKIQDGHCCHVEFHWK